jgi:hypothetical protein
MRARNKHRVLAILACALALLMVIAGCKKDEKQSGFSGTIVVSGGSADGVEVMVFDEPNITPTTSSVWGTTARYPVVGFPYTPGAAFDWRLEQAHERGTATTGSDGKFDVPNLSDGNYIIVARKDGFGWTQPKTAALQGKNQDIGTLTLYAEELIPDGNSITQNTHWLTGHHYVIANRAFLETGVTLTVDPGAVVRFGPGGLLSVFGTLISEGSPEQYIHYTSNVLTSPFPGDWTSVSITAGASPPLFRYCTFDYSQYGILSDERGGVVENCYFANIIADGMDLNGLHALAGDSIVVRHNVIDHTQIGVRAVYIGNSTPATIDHNVIANCFTWGIEYVHNQGGQIFCNYIVYCGRTDSVSNTDTGGLHISESNCVDISNNIFYVCWRSISTGSFVDSCTVIHDNFFRDNPRQSRSVYIGTTESHRGPSYPTLRNNCFVRVYYTVYVDAGLLNTHPIDAKSNYWGTTSETSIRGGIRDHESDPSLPYVLYDPWLDSCPAEATLCTE